MSDIYVPFVHNNTIKKGAHGILYGLYLKKEMYALENKSWRSLGWS